MQPGIYNNITNEAYHAPEGISRSGIMAFRMTPFHYWHDYLNPNREAKKPTRDMIIGSALHAKILEPILFQKKYLFAEKKDRRTKEGKIYWEALELTHDIENIITHDEYEKIYNMNSSILNHIEARDIIKLSSYEHSIYWNDPFTGVLCKARPDIMCDTYIADIKTTDDASPEAFRYSIRKYGYHIQAAMLLDGMNAIKGTNCKNFIIIAAEKKPPYAVAVYLLDEAAIEIGRETYKSSLIEYKKCLEENNWPSYQTQTISI